ncbi:MAG: tetratricopeptide repeat protein [Deinococcales bacterium]
MAFSYHLQGDWYLSISHYRDAQAYFNQEEAYILQLIAKGVEASIYHAQDRCTEASRALLEVPALVEQAQKKPMESQYAQSLIFSTLYNTLGNVEVCVVERDITLNEDTNIEACIADQDSASAQTKKDNVVYDKARQYFEQAIACLERVREGNELTVDRLLDAISFDDIIESLKIVAETNLAWLSLKEGNYTEAQTRFQAILAKIRGLKVNFVNDLAMRPLEPYVLKELGISYLYTDERDRARAYLQEALEKSAGFESPQLDTIEILQHLALIDEQNQDFDKALDRYKEAIALAEAARVITDGFTAKTVKQGNLNGFIALSGSLVKVQAIYNQTARLYLKLNQAEAAFRVSEQGRARFFLDLLNWSQFALDDPKAQEIWEEARAQYLELKSAQQLSAMIPQVERQHFDQQVAQLQQEHEALIESVRARADNLASFLPSDSHILNLPQIQALLDDETTLLSYYYLDNDQIAAFIISKTEFRSIVLPLETTSVLATMQDWEDTGRATGGKAHPSELISLYQMLIAPLKPYLHTPNLGIIAHQDLHYVPFAGLTDGSRYVADDYNVFHLPSASSLATGGCLDHKCESE